MHLIGALLALTSLQRWGNFLNVSNMVSENEVTSRGGVTSWSNTIIFANMVARWAHGHWHFAVVVRAYDSDWWAQRINRMIELKKMQMHCSYNWMWYPIKWWWEPCSWQRIICFLYISYVCLCVYSAYLFIMWTIKCFSPVGHSHGAFGIVATCRGVYYCAISLVVHRLCNMMAETCRHTTGRHQALIVHESCINRAWITP